MLLLVIQEQPDYDSLSWDLVWIHKVHFFNIQLSVQVREANPRPNFVQDLFLAGVSFTTDSIGTELLTVRVSIII